MLRGKTVVLGVTGSIAAYKIANLASMLKKLHCNVHVLMTQNATNFINPITFETLTENRCLIDTFDRNFQYNVEHVSIAKQADVVLIAPATANVIGKLANGIADDMLTTTVMACPCHKILAPAMNTNMYHNPILQDNLQKLERFGYEVITPASGRLACGDVGEGKMPDEEMLLAYILKTVACEKDMAGKKVLITAGATRESLDPVRFITNHSSGKMGFALAKAAMLRGAQVTVVAAHTDVAPPKFVTVIPVQSAGDMFREVTAIADDFDIIIKAAAVADYRPEICQDTKIKKKSGQALVLTLTENPDVAQAVAKIRKPGQTLVGFAAETDHVTDLAKEKLKKKKLDMIVANDVTKEGAGFNTDTNIAALITNSGMQEYPLMPKRELADIILDEIAKIRENAQSGED